MQGRASSITHRSHYDPAHLNLAGTYNRARYERPEVQLTLSEYAMLVERFSALAVTLDAEPSLELVPMDDDEFDAVLSVLD